MSQKMMLSMMIPILSIITVIVIAGGIGVLFIVLEVTSKSETPVVILGTIITILVPAIAFLIQRTIEK